MSRLRIAPNRWILGLVAASPLLLGQSDCDSGGGDAKPATLPLPPAFADPSVHNAPIPADATVDPDSDLYVARMMELQQTGGFVMPINEWSYPIFYADVDTPRFDVALTAYGTSSYYGKQLLMDVPIPPFAEEDPAGDHHMIVIDEVQGCVYDFWGYDQSLVDQPNAWWASGMPLNSDGVAHACTSASNGANLASSAGMVFPEELALGEIDHALQLTMDSSAVKAGGPVPPATHSDGASEAPDAIPEGALVQLDPDLDLDTLDLDPHERVIARALQVYGMYLVDRSGGGVRVRGASALSADPNPWVGLVPDPYATNVSLDNIPVEHLRVLELPEQYPGLTACEDNPCGIYL